MKVKLSRGDKESRYHTDVTWMDIEVDGKKYQLSDYRGELKLRATGDFGAQLMIFPEAANSVMIKTEEYER